MSQLFEATTRPNADLFFKKQDVSADEFQNAVLANPNYQEFAANFGWEVEPDTLRDA